jgi:hypothetical protein
MILTENQYRKLLEALNLKSPFANLSVGKIIVVTAKSAKTGEPFDFKFKVVEDLGDSWKLESLTQDSTFTGFEWIIKKNEDVSDSDIKSKNISKKSKKETNYTLKRVTAMDLDDASADDDEDEAPVDGEDVEHPEEGEKCVIDNKDKGNVVKYAKCYKDRIIEDEINELRNIIQEDKGFFFETNESNRLTFNVLSKTDKVAVMQLMIVDDSRYSKLKHSRFNLFFKNGVIEPSDKTEFYRNFNLVQIIGKADGTDEYKPIKVSDVSDYNVTEWVDKIGDEEDAEGNVLKSVNGIVDDLKKLIDENDYFKLTLGDSSTMTFNVVDKKEAKVLGKGSTLKSATIKLVDTDNEKFSKRVGVQLVIDFSKPDDLVKLNGDVFDLILKGKQVKKPFFIKNIKKYEPTSFTEIDDEEDEDELTSDELFDLINSNPNLKKFFVDRPKLLGFIEGADYKGLSRVYQILNNKGFVSDDEKSGKITTEFSNNRFVEFKYLKDITLDTKPGSAEPKLELKKGVDERAKIQKVKEKTYFSYTHKINDTEKINVKMLLTDEAGNGVFNVKVYTDNHLEKKTKIKVIKYNII